jgi:hypothetical protein
MSSSSMPRNVLLIDKNRESQGPAIGCACSQDMSSTLAADVKV